MTAAEFADEFEGLRREFFGEPKLDELVALASRPLDLSADRREIVVPKSILRQVRRHALNCEPGMESVGALVVRDADRVALDYVRLENTDDRPGYCRTRWRPEPRWGTRWIHVHSHPAPALRSPSQADLDIAPRLGGTIAILHVQSGELNAFAVTDGSYEWLRTSLVAAAPPAPEVDLAWEARLGERARLDEELRRWASTRANTSVPNGTAAKGKSGSATTRGVPNGTPTPAPRPVLLDGVAPDAREALGDFWRTRPLLHHAETTAHGVDPAGRPIGYFRRELAEPEHGDVREAVEGNGGTLTLALAERWISQEDPEPPAASITASAVLPRKKRGRGMTISIRPKRR